MSESLDKEDCAITALVMAVVLLLMYAAIDMWADRREEFHVRNLQQRVAILEQQCGEP